MTIRTDRLVVKLDQRLVTVDGNPVHLTPKEYEILELLSSRKGMILTKEMILNHLYGGMDEPEIKIIDVFVCKLRKKLTQATGGDHYIDTIWGRGYVLQNPAIGLATTAGAIDRGLPRTPMDGARDRATRHGTAPGSGRRRRRRNG